MNNITKKYTFLYSFFKKINFIDKKCLSMQSHKPRIDATGYALLAIPVITFGLGTWQVQRRNWKLGLIKELGKKTTSPPIDLPQNLDEISELEYRKIKVRGKFDHSREIYLHPRTLVQKGKQGNSSLISSGQGGVHVITPFHLADRDLTILVNRGWVPKKKTDPRTREDGQIKQEHELIGIVRLEEKRAPFMPKNQSDSIFYFFRDINVMAEMCKTAPIFLDVADDVDYGNGPIGGQTVVTLRNEHMSYILTWYSLSAATLYLWYNKMFRSYKRF